MTASSGLVTKRARRFVIASPLFLVGWSLAVLFDLSPGVTLPLVLFGFVFAMVFGKAYALVPSYFGTTLTPAWAPFLQLPLTVGGALGLAGSALAVTPAWVGQLSAGAWALGTLVFVGAITWTIRGNVTGAATGTSDANQARERLDRLANAGVPVVLAYLLAGSYLLVATRTTLPTGGVSPAGTIHLLAAGGAAMLVFAVGFRLFPRFLVATPPRGLPPLVLATGAIAPAILAVSLYGDTLFRFGAVCEAIAVLGFGLAYAILFTRSDRDRIALYGPLMGVGFGAIGVGLGLMFAFEQITVELIVVHRRVNLVGFLGLTIVGASYQFYPPAVGTFPLAGDRLAMGSMTAIGVGLFFQLGAAILTLPTATTVGEVLVAAGAIAYAYQLLGLLYQRGK